MNNHPSKQHPPRKIPIIDFASLKNPKNSHIVFLYEPKPAMSLQNLCQTHLPFNHNQLTLNLEITCSQPYQQLLTKIKSLKQQKDEVIVGLQKTKKQKCEELNRIGREKKKAKVVIWEAIGRVCKIKEEIQVQKHKTQVIQQFLNHQTEQSQALAFSQQNLNLS